MSSDRHEKIQTLDVTLWVGKSGIEAVTEELTGQFKERDYVKVKFHRSARAGTDTELLAEELAERVGASVVTTRGHTAVLEK